MTVGEFKQWLTQMIAKLIPNHTSHGDDATHIGKVSGGLQIVRQQVHYHFARSPIRQANRSAPKPEVRASEVLALLDRLPNAKRYAMLDFMDRTFGTRLVIELDAAQLRRLKPYVAAVCRNEGV